MPNPSQQRALPRKPCRYLAAGVALAGAGITAVTPAAAPLPRVHLTDIQLSAAGEDIVIDLVRHGQTSPPLYVAGQELPGFPLSALGHQEAIDVGHQLFNELGGPDGVAGIFGGQEIRMSQTAAPFTALEHMSMQPLAGLDEIGGGIYAHDPLPSPGEYLAALPVVEWVLGFDLAWLPGSNDYLGVQFKQNFDNAVQTMYNDAVAAPVLSANGHITDVAFSGEAAISTWTLMNVKNPDLAIFIPDAIKAVSSQNLLSNAAVVEIQGNPTEGWTLVSFGGQLFPQDPGLLTELFVDGRNLITAPQTAAYNIFEAAVTGDPTTIENAFHTGLQSAGAAIVQYPESVIGDVVATVHDFGADVAAGQTPSDAFGSLVLGLA